MKKFAFFLPQFHSIPENDEWWGKGFTEWTNVKKGTPFFKGHNQPVVPLGKNYYNLLNKDTVVWQNQLMHEYGIDGMIYYHYYFNGRLLLEKPCENLLKWKDINQPFFFCWANHTWNRSWEGKRTVLIEQTYGEKDDWEKHFKYLLEFFKDNRYEKYDNKPLFMLFQCEFAEKEEMMKYFDERCKQEGFNGLYLIETFVGRINWPQDLEQMKDSISSITSKVFLREPSVCLNIYKSKFRYYPVRAINKINRKVHSIFGKSIPVIYDGNLFYDLILNEEPWDDFYIHGAFFAWDNTPRHKERGYIINPPQEDKFKKLLAYAKSEECDYIFINAWNEWAEGMMLEPTENNGYKYLEWIKNSIE